MTSTTRCLLFSLCLTGAAHAQGRAITPSSSPDVGVIVPPKAPIQKQVVTVREIALSKPRAWISSENGKTITATMLAFHPEKDQKAPPMPIATRGEKVRLLMGQKIFELELAKLSEADRQFVSDLIARMEAAAKAGTLKKAEEKPTANPEPTEPPADEATSKPEAE